MMTLQQFLHEWHDGSERLLVHTSGSTGEPKALWVEKRCMEASARTTCDFLHLQTDDTALLCMPLDYIAGKMMVVRSLVRGLRLFCVQPCGHPLAGQNSCIVLNQSCLESVSSLPDNLAFAAMVPMQVYNSLQVEQERERLMSIRHLIIGGGAVDEALAEALKAFPHAVWSTYGMTETLSHVALRRLNGPDADEWYTPFEGVSVSLNDDNCLVIDAPAVCAERLVTNDVAELEPLMVGKDCCNQRFRILGRLDNVICSGGVKIQAEEAERLLKPHLHVPYLVTKRHDLKFGEAVVLMVEQSSTISMVSYKETKKQMEKICHRYLPRYWQPRDIVFVPQIPLTETGKPARKKAEQLVKETLSHR